MSEFPTSAEFAGGLTISPSGRLDVTTAPELREQLHDLVRGGSSHLVVDLRGVEAIDSAGLSALISGLRVARQAGGSLRITRPSRQVAEILRLTNLHRVLKSLDPADSGPDDSV